MRELSRFRADRVQEMIKSAMRMGMAEDQKYRLVWHMPDQTEWDVPVDAAGVPFDPSASPSVVPGATITDIPVTVIRPGEQLAQDNPEPLDGIALDPNRIAIMMFAEDYDRVAGFSTVEVDGTRYFFREAHRKATLDSLDFITVIVSVEDQ